MINKENYLEIINNIELAAKKAGQNNDEVKLLAVSKTFSLNDILEVNKLGHMDFGESYVQEFLRKYEENTSKKEIHWHYIGHLQSNKVKYIVNKISMLHTLDRVSLAQELNKRYKQSDASIDALVQVNIGNEPQKSGIAVKDVNAFVDTVMEFDNINIKGLMCIHPFEEPEECRKYFSQMRNIFDTLKGKGYPMHELSMGMSRDYRQAIEEGATIVRVGTAIFGKR